LVAIADEAEQFLTCHPEVNTVDLIFTSMCGVPRGKRLRRQELIPAYETGRFLPLSTVILDITGQDCDATGLVFDTGDADGVALPVPGTLVRTPWQGQGAAQFLTSLYDLNGQPNELDPRYVLRRVIERFERDGLCPVVACELEFYLIDPVRKQDGGIRLPEFRRAGGTRPKLHDVFSLRDLEDVSPFLEELWNAADVQNLPLEGVISEYAPGQYELTLRHGNDALRAADEALMYKRMVKGVAVRHGFEATFMAKPFSHRAGSGLHLHVSVNDASGVNIFASEDPYGAPPLRHAVGGLRQLLGESMAIFAPNMNSYRRFQANSYAPISTGWGLNNRTVALRVPAGAPHTRHIEHRVCGADANPYLALAALLTGVHRGLCDCLDPGPPVHGDGYKVTQSLHDLPPLVWSKAVDVFDKSEAMRDYLGNRFVDMFVSVKRTEYDRFHQVVSALDYDWYLKNA
jgi:glutamine synthetase